VLLGILTVQLRAAETCQYVVFLAGIHEPPQDMKEVLKSLIFLFNSGYPAAMCMCPEPIIPYTLLSTLLLMFMIACFL